MNAESVHVAATDWLNHSARKIRVFRAPARINIIGEHCDYNDGLVLPLASAPHTWVATQPRNDGRVRVHAARLDDEQTFEISDDSKPEQPRWIDYVRGVCHLMHRQGIEIAGADLYVDSDIPMGAGLSSSASLEVACAVAMAALVDASPTDLQLARICRQAEHDFARVACGLMDQYAVACGREGYALLLDCRTETAEPVLVPDDLSFLVIDSGARRQLIDGNYNDRADACSNAVAILQEAGEDIRALRDLSLDTLHAARDRLGDTVFRRARHVVTDIDRVRGTVTAFANADLTTVGRLLNESHMSLRDDFEISCPELDTLADVANQHDAVYGARMMGGGFGGCVLAAVAAPDANSTATDIAKQYGKMIGQSPWHQVVSPCAGASEIVL
ncbi:MAG: galactokinase [Pseudomonadota bacterium]